MQLVHHQKILRSSQESVSSNVVISGDITLTIVNNAYTSPTNSLAQLNIPKIYLTPSYMIFATHIIIKSLKPIELQLDIPIFDFLTVSKSWQYEDLT
jgi:hypothetical protein